MRIDKIKISGFKSFVDPISITLPGNLSGIVGPNGCGKSNIIDALIWVMGESSAKHLRGESMSDVIFNGSNTRKPVGQATVEIVFDNSDGSIGGQYAAFGEIAIKRTITRDAISSYFLNGTKCRRKDITNVFLGTGISARGYSVIEQGTISRVIEARPEELRNFLEEAAGISKYKEKRRETSNRMNRTSENISRLDDMRDELDKQINHLKRQAREAKRFRELKERERELQANILTVRWQSIEAKRIKAEESVAEKQKEVTLEMANLQGIESNQVALNEGHQEQRDEHAEVQEILYEQGSAISKFEQSLEHHSERENELITHINELKQAVNDADEKEAKYLDELKTIRTNIAEIAPSLTIAKESERRLAEGLNEAENEFLEWQTDWDKFNEEHTELSQRKNRITVQLEYLLEELEEQDERNAHLSTELRRNDSTSIKLKIDEAESEVRRLEKIAKNTNEHRTKIRTEKMGIQQELEKKRHKLHETLSELEQIKGRMASLRELQKNAFGTNSENMEVWLQNNGGGSLERLAEIIEVENGWEIAVEAALRVPLSSWCGYGLTDIIANQQSHPAEIAGQTGIEKTDSSPLATKSNREGGELLLNKIKAPVDLYSLLSQVYVADSVLSAKTIVATLGEGSIAVTKNGTLVSQGWVQIPKARNDHDSIIYRENIIGDLSTQQEQVEVASQQIRLEMEQIISRIKNLEGDENSASSKHSELEVELEKIRSNKNQMEAEYQRREARVRDVTAQVEKISEERLENQALISRLKNQNKTVEEEVYKYQDRRRTLLSRRDAVSMGVEKRREEMRSLAEKRHSLELELQRAQSEETTWATNMERERVEISEKSRQLSENKTILESMKAPKVELREALEDALRSKTATEGRIASSQNKIETFIEKLKNTENERLKRSSILKEKEKELDNTRLDLRALEARLQELSSRFDQQEVNLEDQLRKLSEHDSFEFLEEQLTSVEKKISRLGAINLAAIDELKQFSERKDYLDKQKADLSAALSMLSGAIRKIDMETKTRFKETFDRVNNGIQKMFPVLFGGGHAYIELTGKDLLETGVTVMARPPGKRNSSIQLLSGGEKALTALSFVFALFELNPAPFCLLDEVDAPLDDANVVRLIDMLKSMSETVQFLFVSHNKITMEIAEQLIGVTMQEPGVSRLVSVNMEEAVKLAANG